jgi:hypothetical protein
MGKTSIAGKTKLDNEHEVEGPERAAPESSKGPMADRLLEMQRVAGNASVNAFVQTKLLVGPADDPYEREADEFASRVVGHSGATTEHADTEGDAHGAGFAASGALADYVHSGGGSALPGAVRRKLEPSFGLEFSDVRVHADAKAASMAESIGAQAFTHGNDVYFGKGAYDPGSPGGQHLLAHELTHVVQQTGSAQRSIARKYDGSKVPSRLAHRRIQGNFLKKAKDKAKQFFGKSDKDVRETTGDENLDAKSKPELQQYMARTKGGGPSENPDWSNPKFFGKEPTKFKVKLAVAQEDANWLKNVKALRNAGYKSAFSSKGRQALGNMDKDYLAQKALESQGGLDGLTDPEIKEKIKKFTDGIYDVGHTWIRLETYVGSELKDLYSYGMWPAKIASLEAATEEEGVENYGGFAGPVNLGQGEIRHPDNMHEGDKMTMYYAQDAKKAQFDKALALAGQRYAAPPPYVLVGYNCTAFAREVFQAGGGSYPSGGRLLPGFAYTPGNLYAAIAKKAEEEEKQKAKGKSGKGKAVKEDEHKDLLDKVKEKQAMLASAGKRDTESETFAVPSADAKTKAMTFFSGNTIRFGQRPDFAKDSKMTLDKDKQMTAVENLPVEDRWDVMTFWLGPKKYMYVPIDDVEKALEDPKKKKKKEEKAKPGGSPSVGPKFALYGTMNPPTSDDTPPSSYGDPARIAMYKVQQTKNGWVELIDFQIGEFYWAKESHYNYFKDPKSYPLPPELGGAAVGKPGTEDEQEDDVDAVVSKDSIPLYNQRDLDDEPMGLLPTGMVDDEMLDFDYVSDGWLSVYIASQGGSSYYVSEADWLTWKKLTGRK